MYTSDQRLWLTEDRSVVVPDGDPAARWLLVGEGGELADDVAAQYGLNKAPKAGQPDDAPAAEDAPAEARHKVIATPPHTQAMRPPKGGK